MDSTFLLFTLFVFVIVILVFPISYLVVMGMFLLDRMRKYILTQEHDLLARYGENSYVLITGASSGQGRVFALELASRGFNVILCGRKGIVKVKREISSLYPECDVVCVQVDFCNAFEDDFFVPFEQLFREYDISVCINNVGHRTGWNPSHLLPEEKIKDTIACGTIVQARLCSLAISSFLTRTHRSALINNTGLNVHRSFLLSRIWEIPSISVPYMNVYEGANAFGYAHSNSLFREYGDHIDILTLTPGAVITENTSYLNSTPFAARSEEIVRNAIKFLGNVEGPTCASIYHECADLLGFVTPYKDYHSEKVGKLISEKYMQSMVS